MAHHGRTLNLQGHLDKKHPQTARLRARWVRRKQLHGPNRHAHKGLITQFAMAKPTSSPCSDARKNAINDLLVNWSVNDLCLLNAFAGEGFKCLLSFLEPSYTVPSRTYLVTQSKLWHEWGKEQVKQDLANVGVCASQQTSELAVRRSLTIQLSTLTGACDLVCWKPLLFPNLTREYA